MNEAATTTPTADSAPAGRIGAIPTLPIFFKLAGRPVVVAGGSAPAVWKAELLGATGASVRVFAPDPCAEMIALTRRGSFVTLESRPWTAADLADAALAIGALESDAAEAFRDAARAAGVPVNIIDVPHLCDFQFGTIVARSPLLIAISTDGAAPVFGQALRTRIEGLLPEAVAAWAQAAKDWRPDLQARDLGFAARRRFWECFADRALAGSGGSPTEADRKACLEAASAEAGASAGSLDLVGLGPGDPDLVTLRAVRALQSADVIVYAAGLPQALTTLGRREARVIVEPSDPSSALDLVERLVSERHRVAWAGPGDPDACPCWQDRRTASRVAPRAVVAGLPCGTCPRQAASRPSGTWIDQ